MTPFQQGEFDGFCAIYSIINALCLLFAARRPLSYAECEALCRQGIDALHGQGRLRAAACWGVSARVWHRLIHQLSGSAATLAKVSIRVVHPLREEPGAELPAIFAAVQQAIDRGWPVLVLLRGAYRHYSVIRGYTAGRLLLHDSYGYAWIEKAACGTASSSRRHQLPATALTVLEFA